MSNFLKNFGENLSLKGTGQSIVTGVLSSVILGALGAAVRAVADSSTEVEDDEKSSKKNKKRS